MEERSSFKIPSHKRFFRRKKFWRACLWSLLTVAIVAAAARNIIARAAIECVGSFVLGNPVAVRQVRIQWKTVEISGLEVKEASLAGAPQLQVHTISLAPTIWRGLRQGVWLRYAIVRKPTLHLRFDRRGKLLSRFPQTKPDTALPLRLPFDRVALADGVVVIHQEGKPTCMIRGASLNVTVDHVIHLRAQVSDLLGAQLLVESRVDRSTLGGRTDVSLGSMHFDTRRLARLPLVPGVLADHRLQATMKASLQMQHPANELDFRRHVVALRAKVADVVDEQYGRITEGIDVRAWQRDGRACLRVEGPISSGRLELHADLKLAEPVPRLAAALRLADVELEPLFMRFAPGFPVSGYASANGSAEAEWKDQVLTFRGAFTPLLTRLRANGIPVQDPSTEITCEGTYDPNRTQPLTGSLCLETASDGIELSAVARRFGRSSAAGRVGWRASGMIPLADPWTASAVVAVHSGPLMCEGLTISPLSLIADLHNGQIKITLKEAAVAAATTVDTAGECLVKRLQLADSLQLKTRFDSSVPLARAGEPAAWRASLVVDVRGLAVAHEPLSDFTVSCQLADGELNLAPGHVRWRDSNCHFSGTGDLRGEPRATLRFAAGPIALRDVSDLASRFSRRPLPLSGTALARGSVDLDLRRLGFTASGDLSLSQTQYGGTRIGDARLHWEAHRQAATIRSASNDFFGGEYTVEASLHSLDWTKTTLVAAVEGIQLKQLAGVGGRRIPVSGVVDGSLRMSSIGELESLSADGWLRTREATMGGAPIELQTQLNVRDGLATIAVRGGAFDGTLNGDASTRLRDLSAWLQSQSRNLERIPVFGRIQVNTIEVMRTIAAFDKKRILAPLSGSIKVDCVRDQAMADKGLLAAVDCSLENLRWHQAVMSRRISADAQLYPGRLEVNHIDGQFADGNLSGDAILYFARVPTGKFRFQAEHVTLRRALVPVLNSYRTIHGTASVAVAGRLGSTSTATAKLEASNVTVGDLMIRELRLPLACSFRPSSQIHWQSRGGSLSVGGGNVAINSEGRLASGLVTMSTNIDIRRVDTARLARHRSFSAGIVDGNVHLQSKRARTAKDLTGRFSLQLSQIRSLEMPGLRSFMQLVKLPTLSGAPRIEEDGGMIDGRLAGGLLHLDNFALSKSGVLVLASGTSTFEGRLDVDVAALTHQSGPADGLLALADSPLMLAASAPVALLVRANEAIKDRVVHVHLGGTCVRPSLRLQPGKTLSQDALRFFIAGTLGSGTADIALRRQKHSIR